MAGIHVSMFVITDNQDQAVRVLEAFSRVATGLALDGVDVHLSAGPPESDDDA